MWNNIKMLPLLLYMRVTGAVRSFKEDERGLSGVVVAVMLILVAVLAVILIWTLLGQTIQDWWAEITGQASGLDVINPT